MTKNKLNKQKIVEIKKCRSCYSEKLVDILSLGNQCLSDFITFKKKLEKFPLDLILCLSCNLVQLRHTVSSSLLYTERYGYKSGINKTMKIELKEIVEKAQEKINISLNKFIVVDIGANDGTLLGNYPKHIFKVGVEPIKKFAKECIKKSDIVINDFFSYEVYVKKMKEGKAHIITAISCFYDIEDPNMFLSDIKKILHEDGIFIVQQNYLVGMLKQGAFDNIVHEHLEYYSLLSLENLLGRHSLEIINVEISGINGGSFRTYISHKGKKSVSKSVEDLRKSEIDLRLNKIQIYNNFAKNAKKIKRRLNKLITDLVKKNKKIYIYGASTRGNTLLQYCNLDNNLIKAAVERYPEKWGKKIASVNIPIISEKQARFEKPDYMLVLPWFFKEEFLEREKAYLKNGGHFIFPLPALEVI